MFDNIREIEFSSLVVVAKLAEKIAKTFKADRHGAAVAKRDAALFFTRILALDNARKKPFAIEHEAAIGSWIASFNAENEDRRFRVTRDRKSVWYGKRGSIRVELGGQR